MAVCLLKRSVLSPTNRFLVDLSSQRFINSSAACRSFEKSPVQVTLTDDGRTIVCYHPASKKSFPYELSKPLPEVLSAAERFKDSALDPNLMENNRIRRKLTDEDLIRLTYRPGHVWKTVWKDGRRPVEPKIGEMNRKGI